MHLRICDSVLHFSCVESETVFIKEELSELSTRYEDKLTESTEVEIDNWDKHKKLHGMTEEMVNRLVIAKKIFSSIFVFLGGGGGGKVTSFLYLIFKNFFLLHF